MKTEGDRDKRDNGGSCASGHCHRHGHNHHEGATTGFVGRIKELRRELLSGAMLLACVVMAHLGVFDYWTTRDGGGFDWVMLLCYVLAVLPVGLAVLRDAVETWRRGDFMNEFTLMLLAAVGAYCIGEYPEGVAVLLFYSFGERLEDRASDDVRRKIKALLEKLPDEVAVVGADGAVSMIDPREVKAGSEIIVKPGERAAIDGILLAEGSVDFDTSAMTGESVPRAYHHGEEVLSGMIPVDREVRLRTSRPFADSSMSRILRMIEEASAGKSPTETMLRRVTRFYTPLVFVLALLLFVVPWIVSLFPGAGAFDAVCWLRRSLVFLVCSCPCALVVSIPLSYFVALGNASRMGLLFKGSRFIDAMRRLKVVAFDKTGTLTTGKFSVDSIVVSPGISEEQVLTTAAALDAQSSHPLATAVCAYARENGMAVPEATGVRTVTHGIAGMAGGIKALAGSRKLMAAEGISVPPAVSPLTEICVAVDGRYIGSILLADTVKANAREAVDRLHGMGVKEVMVLSGDREEAVSRVAGAIGADSYRAELLPGDKQKIVSSLRERGRAAGDVAFVGDGINDAPAIAASDIGMAMGTLGTDVAMQSADVVIAGDDLSRIPAAMRLARKVHRVMAENLVFALGVKAAVMILGAFGIATLWAAVFADTGVTLIAIMWTLLRLGAFRRTSR